MSDNKIESQKRIDWVPAIFLIATPTFAVLLTTLYFYLYEFNWWLAFWFVFFYSASALSITAGYHRLFAHRAYEANSALKVFFALFGAAAFQNSILKWATDHRIHHRFVDHETEDPYSISRGFFHAHIGWMLFKSPPHPMEKSYSRDLEKDAIVQFQDRHYLAIAILMGFFVPALLGQIFAGSALGGLAIIGCLRMTALHHGTFFINSWCHMWGKQTYTDKNSAKDSFLMAVATFGEGYHNFHHLFANDYRNGIRWYHWDPTKWMIKACALLGFAEKLRKTPDLEILKAKMEMDSKALQAHPHALSVQVQERLQLLKQKVQDAQENFKKIREEYKRQSGEKALATRHQIALLQAELRLARLEFSKSWAQWKAYNRTLQRSFSRNTSYV